MICCRNQAFEAHADPRLADLGKGGGAEHTVGHCKSCGALLINSWLGGVIGSNTVVSQEWIDSVRAAAPEQRKKLLDAWFDSD